MSEKATPADFRNAFFRRYSPICASQIVRVLDYSASRARALCETEYPTGNYGVAQGINRWQLVDEHLRRQALLDGDVIVETRDFGEAKLLDGEEKINSFVLLRSNEVGLVLCKVRRNSPMPSASLVRNYMTALGFASEPLFPIPYYLEARYGDSIPKHDLKALFIGRYWLDEEDEAQATIEKADIVVLTHDGKSIFGHVCTDLYSYADTASVDTMYVHGEELPIAFRIPERAPETETEILPINLRSDDNKGKN